MLPSGVEGRRVLQFTRLPPAAPGYGRVSLQWRTRPSAVRIVRSTYFEPVCFCGVKST